MNDRLGLSRVVAIATGKGGTGKSTLTANIAGMAAAVGHRVLVIDLDPQGDVAYDLGYDDDPRADDGHHLATAMLTGRPLSPVLIDVRPNLDVITGGEHLRDVNAELLARQATGDFTFDLLAKALAFVAPDYDLVIIDTPPYDDESQLLALAAARWALVPTKAEPSSIRAMTRVSRRCAEIRANGHQVDILGVALVGVRTEARKGTHVRSAARELGEHAPLFDGSIRDAAAIAQESRERGLLVHELVDDSNAAKIAADYIVLTEQMLDRIDRHERTLQGSAA